MAVDELKLDPRFPLLLVLGEVLVPIVITRPRHYLTSYLRCYFLISEDLAVIDILWLLDSEWLEIL